MQLITGLNAGRFVGVLLIRELTAFIHLVNTVLLLRHANLLTLIPVLRLLLCLRYSQLSPGHLAIKPKLLLPVALLLLGYPLGHCLLLLGQPHRKLVTLLLPTELLIPTALRLVEVLAILI